LPSPLRLALHWLPALAWASLIFYLSSQPEPLGQQPDEPESYAAHFAVFGMLAALLLFATMASLRPGRWTYLAVLAATSLYAVTDEVHQAFVPGRSADPRDWVMDTIGAAAALTLLALLQRSGLLPALHGRRLSPGRRHHDVAE
jgi:VanZ family protein